MTPWHSLYARHASPLTLVQGHRGLLRKCYMFSGRFLLMPLIVRGALTSNIQAIHIIRAVFVKRLHNANTGRYTVS